MDVFDGLMVEWIELLIDAWMDLYMDRWMSGWMNDGQEE